MIRLIITDDHVMFRESISKMLTMKKIAEVEAEASNGVELLKLLETHKPDLVLMDISMPEMDGIEATRKAMVKYPDLKILTLSSFGDEKYYFSMLEAGTKGFVLKSTTISELEMAIKEVAGGGSWFSTELLQKVILNISSKPRKEEIVDLSERELEILKLICENMTNEQIASRINLSYDTVKWHRANILAKTGCNNAVGLLLFAIKNKLIEI
ncbi:MAG TPA: response regulator transcription factor [Bacteroidales bacterium]|nr:response regulator transcription factor [Bacteroidales bacterium]HPT11198.1 response regulator transcription factor [Bacteroidales bacterium]